MTGKRQGRDEYITLAEAARRMGRSRQIVQRWVAQKRIKHKLVAGRPVIAAKDCKLPKFMRPGRK